MKMRDVEHAAGLFTNGLAASFYASRLSGFHFQEIIPPSDDRVQHKSLIDQHICDKIQLAIFGMVHFPAKLR